MKKKGLNILAILFVIILFIIIFVLTFTLLMLYRNHTIIKRIQSEMSYYIDNAMNDFHIKVEYKASSAFEENDEFKYSTKDIYRKGFIVKSISLNDDNTYVHYEDTSTEESYLFNIKENTKIGYGRSIIREFLDFLDLYYANMPRVKITVNDDYYIVKYPTSNYYFDKENYRIKKIEVFSDVKVWSETIYTYFDNEEITDEMVAMPEI
ncbi:MAG: hypothetical protein IJW20_04665 [Clostridia bacterium]|nr:hypothetical protein [Clostridia bacterium]